MDWKEQLKQIPVVHQMSNDWQRILTEHISTEIIEKLIVDIPDDLTYDRREGIWHEVGGSKQVKQQLRDKWL
jgi:hypothetical protein